MESGYLEKLPENKTLCIYSGETLVFTSEGKWLHPLFEAESFFKENPDLQKNLCSHDSAIGKAALVLSVRLGIRKIHADLVSELALEYASVLNRTLPDDEKIQITFDNSVPRLMCATEEQLASLTELDEMYFLLRQRARLVQGVSVSLRNVDFPFGGVKNFSLELLPGSHVMVCGENGAGKTTLLRMLSGIIKPKSGEILIDGKKISELSPYTIGYIPQNQDNSAFSLSVEEVVSLGCSGKASRGKLERALERTGALHLWGRSFNTLSGGEKQKVLLARCLCQSAKLLLLDEPTSALDAENRKMVEEILKSFTVSEIPTIIVVTHDKELSSLKGWQRVEL